MKTIYTIAVVLLLVGCATTPTSPPKPFESKFYDIATNWTEVLVWETNSIRITNEAGAITSIDLPVQVPHRVPAYVYTPNTNATAVVEATKGIGNLFGVGELVALVVGGGITLIGTLRSTKKAVNQANATSEVLAQIIETGKKILSLTPQGQKVEAEWVNWMVKHQAEAGVISNVIELLKTAVDKASAEEVAKAIEAKVTTTK